MQPKDSIQDLASELKVLHKALIEAGRTAYEVGHGPVTGTMQLLHLLAHDSAFAWLRPLSELMADLDAVLELGESPNDDERGAVRGELEHLLSPAEPALWNPLTAFIQQSADVATGYAVVRQLLSSLPKPPLPDEAASLHAKHRWAELRLHRQAR
jgi:hypothetical protein